MAATQAQVMDVQIHDQDSGQNFERNAGPGTPIQVVIDDFYKKVIGRDRRATDRLWCKATGEDVFQYAGLHLGIYVETGHCSDLQWLWAGDQGGA
jgi:hypothetical protein